MAGTIVDRQLTGINRAGLRFALATEADDPAMRRLLRNNPMRGEISLSFEREPHYFLGTGIADTDDQTILAFEGDRLLCMGRSSIRSRYINGTIRRVGYLAELRLDASAQGRFDILRGGYQFLRELHRDFPADFYFTSIAADNQRAIRLFERGLRGLPNYRFLAEFVTLVIPVSPRRFSRVGAESLATGLRVETGSEHSLPELTVFLNAQAGRQQLAAHWSEDEIRSLANHGLDPGHFQLLRDGGKIVACAGLWDQRVFRQTVIRGYGTTTRLIRPWVNFVGRFLSVPRLPNPGSILAQAFVSPFATAPGHEPCLPILVELFGQAAAQRGIGYLTLGLAAGDARLALLKKQFYCRSYGSRLYRVNWPDDADVLHDEGQFPCLPEVGLL